jgi:hypothetical protein
VREEAATGTHRLHTQLPSSSKEVGARRAIRASPSPLHAHRPSGGRLQSIKVRKPKQAILEGESQTKLHEGESAGLKGCSTCIRSAYSGGDEGTSSLNPAFEPATSHSHTMAMLGFLPAATTTNGEVRRIKSQYSQGSAKQHGLPCRSTTAWYKMTCALCHMLQGQPQRSTTIMEVLHQP